MYYTNYSTSTSEVEDLLNSLGGSSSLAAAQGAAIWTVISLILALVGGLVIYFLFVKKKVNPVNKFLVWMKGFLKFEKILVEDILKISYLVLALFITLSSFGMIGYSFLGFLCTLILGNLFLRVAYELTMMVIMIWSNTNAIRQNTAKEAPKVKEIEAKKK